MSTLEKKTVGTKLKKWTTFVFTGVLALSLAACGSDKVEPSATPLVSAAVSGTAAPEATKAPLKPVKLLNVSYDPTRELYASYNIAFAKYWKDKTGQEVTIDQSHGGSGKQARSVIDGQEADVVTLALSPDIDAIQAAGFINEGWEKKFEQNSTPYTSTIVFLVRKGNSKGIKDWDDLVKPGVSVITPNPKTSGGARWNFIAAWGYALQKNNNDAAIAKEFVTKLFKNVPVLDSGARASTNTFVQKELGDVLISWENEAYLALKEFGADKFEIITPSISILAEPPVAIVDRTVDKRETREVAEAYLQYLYSEEGQTIAAENFYRPRLEAVAAKYADKFATINLFTINDLGFDGWKKVQETYFADKAIFDQIYIPS